MPGFERLKTVHDASALYARTVRIGIRPPYPWLRDSVVQFSTIAQRAATPLAISMMVYIVGYAVFYTLSLTEALGISDRQPGVIFPIAVREICVWVSTMIFAGVAGSAVCADFGARRIREEFDALEVLGVDSIRALVVPRFVAMVALAPVMGLVGLFVAMLAMYVVTPLAGGASAPLFRDSVARSVIPVDLLAFLVKLVIVGNFVAAVAAAKGLTCSGGAEGVGRAVNETVVISFFGIWLINSLFNIGYLALAPDIVVLRG